MVIKLLVKLTTIILTWCIAIQYGHANVNSVPEWTEIKSLNERFHLTPTLHYIDNSEIPMTIDDILENPNHLNWQKMQLGLTEFANKYWFRIDIIWQGKRSEDAVLYLASQPVSFPNIGMIINDSDKPKPTIFSTGYMANYDSRDIKRKQFAFSIRLEPGKKNSIYGWIDNSETALPLELPIYLISQQDFEQEQQLWKYISIGFYAVMTALLLYNIFLLIILREPLYLIYVFYLVFATLNSALIDGTCLALFWQNSPNFNAHALYAIGAITMMLYLAFIFESVNDIGTWITRKSFYMGVTGFGVPIVISSIFALNTFVASALLQIYVTVGVLVALLIIILAIIAKHPTAKYLCIAEITGLSSVLVFIMMLHGILPVNMLSLWSLHWAVCGEAILFSLSLAARTRLIQQQAIDNIEKYELLYTRSVQGLFQYNLQERDLKYNDALANIMGLSTDKDSINSSAMRDKTTALWENNELVKKLYQKGSLNDIELQIPRDNDNSTIWVSMDISVVYDADGKPLYLEGSVLNINARKLKDYERKLKEEALQLALNNMQESDKLKQSFLSTLSHEMRTPMNKMLTTLSYLVAKQCSAKVAGYHRSLTECCSDMMQLLDRILDFTKIQSGKLQLQESPFKIDDLIHNVKSIYTPLCQDKGLDFLIEREGDFPNSFLGDHEKLNQIITNLLNNALKFTNEGSIIVKVSACPKPTTDNAAQQDDPRDYVILFSVQDTGIGVDVQDRRKIFADFSQADGSFKREHGGLGIGLAICREFINLMGGTLTYMSLPGKGTRFDCIVDLAASQPS